MTCPCCGACHLDGPRACVSSEPWVQATALREVRAEIDRLRSDFRAESLARGRTTVALAEAREEMDRLRRLPVIATCGKCGWHRVTRVFADRADYCGHHSARNGDVGNGEPPPEWCPLRGAR